MRPQLDQLLETATQTFHIEQWEQLCENARNFATKSKVNSLLQETRKRVAKKFSDELEIDEH